MAMMNFIYDTKNVSGEIDVYAGDENLRIGTWCGTTGGLGGGITLSRTEALALAAAITKHFEGSE